MIELWRSHGIDPAVDRCPDVPRVIKSPSPTEWSPGRRRHHWPLCCICKERMWLVESWWQTNTWERHQMNHPGVSPKCGSDPDVN